MLDARPVAFLALIIGIPYACLLAAIAATDQTVVAFDGLSALRFVAEGGVIYAAVLALLRRPSTLRVAAAVTVLTASVSIVAIQAVTYFRSYAFLSRVALANTDNIGLILARPAPIILLFATLYAAAAAQWIMRGHVWVAVRLRHPAATAALCLMIAVVSTTAPARADANSIQSQALAMPSLPPVTSLTATVLRLPGGKGHDPASLTDHIAESLVVPVGTGEFPLMRDVTYRGNPRRATRPNVLILFTEGMSARTLGQRTGPLAGLTPNIDAFFDDAHTTVFSRYYNHTAPTFSGIFGQLCSLYPPDVANDAWRTYAVPLHCLPHHFAEAGYATEFFDPHYTDDYLHDLIAHLGFDRVLTAEDILAEYGVTEGVRLAQAFGDIRFGLRNRPLFDAVLEEMNGWGDGTPHLLATYPLDTHAWLDTVQGEVRWGDGANNTLNTIHEADAAFGAFWRAFQDSPRAQDTVVVFTADHSRFAEASYAQAVSKYDLGPIDATFVDAIPFGVYDPSGTKNSVDAHFGTSINFAPTVAEIVGLPNGPSHFLGESLLGRQPKGGLAVVGPNIYAVTDGGVMNIGMAKSPPIAAIKETLHRAITVATKGPVWPSH